MNELHPRLDQSHGDLFALGFSSWKRPLVRRFLPERRLRFVRHLRQVPEDAAVAVWANHPQARILLDRPAAETVLLEDGFLRSVGLGAELTSPSSWVADQRGIYYDATRQSDLEVLLQKGKFDPDILSRANSLRLMILSRRLTKYNVGLRSWPGLSPLARAAPEVVLVAGQVESDASIQYGAPGIRTNMELLRAARDLHPSAWLIYKPHPDVEAGLRMRGADEALAHQFCDEIAADAPLDRLLEFVSTVHVMTSLTGFEALLREKRVVCHGLPFYAGWGLTEDHVRTDRRTRRLALDELVAGALIRYPRYVSRASGCLCEVEQAVLELASWNESSVSPSSPVRKILRPILFKP